MRASAELPLGVASLFGASARRRRELEERLAGLLAAAGFEEVILPVLDYVEPYEALLTPEVRSELYRFSDRDGELLALRADFTPLLARLLAPRLHLLPLPQRLFYRGDVVRRQLARVGREREMFQLGAEVLGLPGAAAEREALLRFLALLEAAAPGPARVVVGTAGALDELLLAAPDPAALATAVARRERAPARRAGRAMLEVARWGMPAAPADLGAPGERVAELAALVGELATRHPGLALEVDLAEFATLTLDPRLGALAGPRGYYDGVVFRAYVGDSGVPVGSGGRYDRLFHRLGAPLTAAGFSFGLDRLLVASGAARAAVEVAAAATGPGR